VIGHSLWEIQRTSSSLLSTIIFSMAVFELFLILVAKYTVYFRLYLFFNNEASCFSFFFQFLQ
jgi:hypothetical protein